MLSHTLKAPFPSGWSPARWQDALSVWFGRAALGQNIEDSAWGWPGDGSCWPIRWASWWWCFSQGLAMWYLGADYTTWEAKISWWLISWLRLDLCGWIMVDADGGGWWWFKVGVDMGWHSWAEQSIASWWVMKLVGLCHSTGDLLVTSYKKHCKYANK